MANPGSNATPPTPAEAPGVERFDPALVARELGERWPGGMDPRVRAIIPAFDAPFFQAGLAGYSDAAMRIVARRHGAPYCVTEALLDRMLLGGGRGFDKADLEILDDALPCGKEDQPLCAQIIGSDPDEMAAGALKMVEQAARPDRVYRDLAYGTGELPQQTSTPWQVCGEDMGTIEPFTDADDETRGAGVPPARTARAPADTSSATTAAGRLSFATIDINLACPVKKIDRKNRGGHWLREPQGEIDLMRAVREALPPSVPCTVKLRRAYDDTPEMARNFEIIFNAAYELGLAWATVHARTVEQRYVGPSRWPFLRDLCSRHPDKIIFGSGDIWETPDIFRMIAYTGVSGVSVARGCIGNPWIFRQARDMIAGKPPLAPTISQQRKVLLEHFRLSVSINGERHASRMMRKFGIRFAQHHPNPAAVKERMISVESVADWTQAVEAMYPAER